MNEVNMTSVITSIGTSLSAANLWAIVGECVPIIAISVLFGLGFYIVKKVLKKLRHPNGSSAM